MSFLICRAASASRTLPKRQQLKSSHNSAVMFMHLRCYHRLVPHACVDILQNNLRSLSVDDSVISHCLLVLPDSKIATQNSKFIYNMKLSTPSIQLRCKIIPMPNVHSLPVPVPVSVPVPVRELVSVSLRCFGNNDEDQSPFFLRETSPVNQFFSGRAGLGRFYNRPLAEGTGAENNTSENLK